MNYTEEDAKRFWNRVTIPDDYINECWICNYSTNQRGYPHFSINGKLIRANKFSYLYYFKYYPDYKNDECVLHTCDIRRCVNPNHLFLGTNLDNMKDRNNKNRQVKGSEIITSKLTDQDVIVILNSIKYGKFKNINEICKVYNVSRNIPEKILKGHIWKHITKNFNLKELKNKIVASDPSSRASKKLNIEKVKDIRKRLKLNEPVRQIANFYNVGISTIYSIKYGNIWQNI